MRFVAASIRSARGRSQFNEMRFIGNANCGIEAIFSSMCFFHFLEAKMKGQMELRPRARRLPSKVIGVVVAGLVGSLAQAASADLIAYWNFNGLTLNTNNGSVYASDFGAGTGTLVGWTPAGISANGGTTINALFPDGPGAALELRNDDNNGATFVIHTDLTFFADPVLSFADRRNTDGFNSIQVAYSTDGLSYSDFGAPFDPGNGVYQLETFDFSGIDALDHASDVFFRLTLNGATADAGRVRIDNIQINGTTASAIPEPGSMFALGALGLVVISWRTHKRRKS